MGFLFHILLYIGLILSNQQVLLHGRNRSIGCKLFSAQFGFTLAAAFLTSLLNSDSISNQQEIQPSSSNRLLAHEIL
jgi:hypothetical protein